jgi:hypothetical protein
VSVSCGGQVRLSAGDAARFHARVVVTDTCAVWLGAVGSDGYGRFAVRVAGRQRTLTPHQVAAMLASGSLAAGATLMHDCEVRLCVSTSRGHVRVATQWENVRQAVKRGRMCGPRRGWVDTRGPVGASRAIQALRAHPGRDRHALGEVLRATLAAGDPHRDNLSLPLGLNERASSVAESLSAAGRAVWVAAPRRPHPHG